MVNEGSPGLAYVSHDLHQTLQSSLLPLTTDSVSGGLTVTPWVRPSILPGTGLERQTNDIEGDHH